MATAAAAVNPQLCDYCHQKPKHGTHSYCSKTCAAQIGTLCSFCGKKPKFQGFEYCGKNCAAAAAAANPGPLPVTTKKNVQAKAPVVGAQTTIDPLQIAKLVAQHIPQVQSFIASVAPQTAPAPAGAAGAPKNNPFLNTLKQAATTLVHAGVHAANNNIASAPAPVPGVPAAAAAQAHPPVQPPACLIPGCGLPVHVDASGAMSDFCSKKHREEAVSSGLVSPCIMCLALPQSETDYFCGRECREEALDKSLGP